VDDLEAGGVSLPEATLYREVLGSLDELFPGNVFPVRSTPAAEVRVATQNGSALTFVSVERSDDDALIVRAVAYVLTDVESSPQLHVDLLHRNAGAVFGAYQLTDEGEVAFSHSLLGEGLTRESLRHAVLVVASRADEEDDDLQARYGGLRAIDRPPVV
jgi:hypothetical protein